MCLRVVPRYLCLRIRRNMDYICFTSITFMTWFNRHARSIVLISKFVKFGPFFHVADHFLGQEGSLLSADARNSSALSWLVPVLRYHLLNPYKSELGSLTSSCGVISILVTLTVYAHLHTFDHVFYSSMASATYCIVHFSLRLHGI